MKNDKTIYFIILIFAFLVLGGFFVVLNQISGLSAEVKNNELNLQLISEKISGATATSTPVQETSTPAQNETSTTQIPSNDIVIPTGIIFMASSSASLQPQTLVTITIEKITKKSDGTVTVALKAFTNEATSYSAITPSDFLQYVSLDSENQKPTDVSSVFASMPPKSVTSGTINFHIDPAKNTMILQTGQGDEPKFYEINFTKGTYKETAIG
jgi:hypothetical protein